MYETIDHKWACEYLMDGKPHRIHGTTQQGIKYYPTEQQARRAARSYVSRYCKKGGSNNA